jgi:hypothetical protein
VRATEAQRHAEALGAADGHVGAELARRGQQGQGQQVGGHGHQGVGGVEALGQCAVVEHVTVARRVLQQGAEERRHVAQFTLVADHHLDAQRLGTGAQHVEGLRVAVHGGEELVAALVLAQALAEGHGFGGGGGFVEQRGVGDRQAGEVADQGLEVQQRFETALGNFRLVRGVGGVPGRVFQQVAQDRRRRVGVVVALADVGLEQLVLGRDGFDQRQGVGFAQAVFRPSTLVPLMLSGITLALRASSESKPRLLSMACSSPARGPMWRAMNSLAVPRLLGHVALLRLRRWL